MESQIDKTITPWLFLDCIRDNNLLEIVFRHKKPLSRALADKFIWNKFEQQSVTMMPRSGEP